MADWTAVVWAKMQEAFKDKIGDMSSWTWFEGSQPKSSKTSNLGWYWNSASGSSSQMSPEIYYSLGYKYKLSSDGETMSADVLAIVYSQVSTASGYPGPIIFNMRNGINGKAIITGTNQGYVSATTKLFHDSTGIYEGTEYNRLNSDGTVSVRNPEYTNRTTKGYGSVQWVKDGGLMIKQTTPIPSGSEANYYPNPTENWFGYTIVTLIEGVQIPQGESFTPQMAFFDGAMSPVGGSYVHNTQLVDRSKVWPSDSDLQNQCVIKFDKPVYHNGEDITFTVTNSNLPHDVVIKADGVVLTPSSQGKYTYNGTQDVPLTAECFTKNSSGSIIGISTDVAKYESVASGLTVTYEYKIIDGESIVTKTKAVAVKDDNNIFVVVSPRQSDTYKWTLKASTQLIRPKTDGGFEHSLELDLGEYKKVDLTGKLNNKSPFSVTSAGIDTSKIIYGRPYPLTYSYTSVTGENATETANVIFMFPSWNPVPGSYVYDLTNASEDSVTISLKYKNDKYVDSVSDAFVQYFYSTVPKSSTNIMIAYNDRNGGSSLTVGDKEVEIPFDAGTYDLNLTSGKKYYCYGYTTFKDGDESVVDYGDPISFNYIRFFQSDFVLSYKLKNGGSECGPKDDVTLNVLNKRTDVKCTFSDFTYADGDKEVKIPTEKTYTGTGDASDNSFVWKAKLPPGLLNSDYPFYCIVTLTDKTKFKISSENLVIQARTPEIVRVDPWGEDPETKIQYISAADDFYNMYAEGGSLFTVNALGLVLVIKNGVPGCISIKPTFQDREENIIDNDIWSETINCITLNEETDLYYVLIENPTQVPPEDFHKLCQLDVRLQDENWFEIIENEKPYDYSKQDRVMKLNYIGQIWDFKAYRSNVADPSTPDEYSQKITMSVDATLGMGNVLNNGTITTTPILPSIGYITCTKEGVFTSSSELREDKYLLPETKTDEKHESGLATDIHRDYVITYEPTFGVQVIPFFRLGVKSVLKDNFTPYTWAITLQDNGSCNLQSMCGNYGVIASANTGIIALEDSIAVVNGWKEICISDNYEEEYVMGYYLNKRFYKDKYYEQEIDISEKSIFRRYFDIRTGVIFYYDGVRFSPYSCRHADFQHEIFAKNILSGVTPYLLRDNAFVYKLNHVQTNGDNPEFESLNEISKIRTNLIKEVGELENGQSDVINVGPNETIQLVRPSLIETANFSVGTKYEYNITQNVSQGSTYTLGEGEWMILYLKETSDSTMYTAYYFGEGRVIKPNNISLTSTPTGQAFTTGAQAIMQLAQGKNKLEFTFTDMGINDELVNYKQSCTATKTISIMERNEVVIANELMYCYWITNDLRNNRYYFNVDPETFEYVLQTNEYFIYTDATKSALHQFGPGTRIKLEYVGNDGLLTNDISVPCVDVANFIKYGMSALEEAFHVFGKQFILTITEQEFKNICDGGKLTISVDGTSEGEGIDNLYLQLTSSGLKYKVTEEGEYVDAPDEIYQKLVYKYCQNSSEQEQTLYNKDLSNLWKLQTYLSINSSIDSPQLLAPDSKKRNSDSNTSQVSTKYELTFYVTSDIENTEESTTVTLEKTSDEEVTYYLQSNKELSIMGGSDLLLDMYSIDGATQYPSFYLYKEQNLLTNNTDTLNVLNIDTAGAIVLNIPIMGMKDYKLTDIGLPNGNYIIPVENYNDCITEFTIHYGNESYKAPLAEYLKGESNFGNRKKYFVALNIDNDQKNGVTQDPTDNGQGEQEVQENTKSIYITVKTKRETVGSTVAVDGRYIVPYKGSFDLTIPDRQFIVCDSTGKELKGYECYLRDVTDQGYEFTINKTSESAPDATVFYIKTLAADIKPKIRFLNVFKYKLNSYLENFPELKKGVTQKLMEYDTDNQFNYVYQPKPESRIVNPLKATSFGDYNHFYNPYTIDQAKTPDIAVVQYYERSM